MFVEWREKQETGYSAMNVDSGITVPAWVWRRHKLINWIAGNVVTVHNYVAKLSLHIELITNTVVAIWPAYYIN